MDKSVDKHGTRKVAEAYLQYLYSAAGQALAAQCYYRPRDTKAVPEEYLKPFPKLELFTVDEVFGGWQKGPSGAFRGGRRV